MRLEKKIQLVSFLGHYEIETRATMKIVFLEDFLGNATFSHSGETNRKTGTKALEIKMT